MAEQRRGSERRAASGLLPHNLNLTLDLNRFLPNEMSNAAHIYSSESGESIKIMIMIKIKNGWHNEEERPLKQFVTCDCA